MSDDCGADCGNVCDIVYEILCGHCVNENKCHSDEIDHCYVVECSMKYLRRTDEFMIKKYKID